MINSEITGLRLNNHQLNNNNRFEKVLDLVSWMGAVQAQDYNGAKWALGLRLPYLNNSHIEQAIKNKEIIRTWSLRGTLHFISAKDILWILELIAPFVIAKTSSQYRKLGLDSEILNKTNKLMIQTMEDGKQLNRQEIFSLLEQHNIPTGEHRGSYILYQAALNKIICLGYLNGKQETYTLLNEWLPETLRKNDYPDHEEQLAKLTKIYFSSHGPATLQDFIWWSGLPVTVAKKGLEIISSELIQLKINEQIYWSFDDNVNLRDIQKSTYLLPAYDEYFLGYKDRSIILNQLNKKQVEPGNGFSPVIISDGQVIGTWRRIIKNDTVTVYINPFEPLSAIQKNALNLAVNKYGLFLNLKPLVEFN